MLKMPGKSYQGPLVALNPMQTVSKSNLHKHIETLATQIGERNIFCYSKLKQAQAYVYDVLKTIYPDTQTQDYKCEGRTVKNIIATKHSISDNSNTLIIGAHYDSVLGSPGADDNASGVAALLELARLLEHQRLTKQVKFIAFVNEEPPFFLSPAMGSYQFAKQAYASHLAIHAMLSLESLGYYDDAINSQQYPFPFNLMYPSMGNFIGFVANLASRLLLKRTIASFREHCEFPSEGAALPSFVTGVAWSDHWSFWKFGYPALMITDTALFRNPFYHTQQDTIETLNLDKLTRVVLGLKAVIMDLSNN